MGILIPEQLRQSMAERQTVDRFTALYLRDRAGAIFRGRVSGVSRFGAFVSLVETGADGILPMRHLPQDFYDHDEKGHRLVGRLLVDMGRRMRLAVGVGYGAFRLRGIGRSGSKAMLIGHLAMGIASFFVFLAWAKNF